MLFSLLVCGASGFTFLKRRPRSHRMIYRSFVTEMSRPDYSLSFFFSLLAVSMPSSSSSHTSISCLTVFVSLAEVAYFL